MKILVVDDEPLARQRLVRLLASLQPDAETEEAGNGESALALVAQFQPDVLLLDIRMPGMDGIAVAEQLETLPEPPAVVFCTAYDEYALEALRHEAVHVRGLGAPCPNQPWRQLRIEHCSNCQDLGRRVPAK